MRKETENKKLQAPKRRVEKKSQRHPSPTSKIPGGLGLHPLESLSRTCAVKVTCEALAEPNLSQERGPSLFVLSGGVGEGPREGGRGTRGRGRGHAPDAAGVRPVTGHA